MAETAKWNAVTSKLAFVSWYVLCLSSVFAFQLSKIDLWYLQFDLELWDDLAGNHQAVDAWRAWKRHFVSATGLEYSYSLYQLQFFAIIRHTVGFCAAPAAAVWNFRACGCPSPRGRAKDIAEWSQSRAKNMLSFAWAKPIGGKRLHAGASGWNLTRAASNTDQLMQTSSAWGSTIRVKQQARPWLQAP